METKNKLDDVLFLKQIEESIRQDDELKNQLRLCCEDFINSKIKQFDEEMEQLRYLGGTNEQFDYKLINKRQLFVENLKELMKQYDENIKQQRQYSENLKEQIRKCIKTIESV